jgi:hypothetical protein
VEEKMKNPNDNPTEETPTKPSAADRQARQDQDYLVRQLRAQLHMAITAEMIEAQGGKPARKGPSIVAYCRPLAHRTECPLAQELGYPVKALLQEIADVAARTTSRLRRADPREQRPEDRKILEEVDVALVVILRNLTDLVRRRAAVTECRDLLCEVLGGWLAVDGDKVAGLIRRYEAMAPDEGRAPDGSLAPDSLPDWFARDVYERVQALEELAEELPDHIRTGAQLLPAWPMLGYRHTERRRRLAEVAARMDLGSACSFNTTAGASYDPDDPLTRYLMRMVRKLESMRAELGAETFETLAQERCMLEMVGYVLPDTVPAEAAAAALRLARQLPYLNTETAAAWTAQVIVPLIIATDARDYRHCADAGLRALAQESEVVDEATFQRRLHEAVGERLARLARLPDSPLPISTNTIQN